MLRYSLVVVVAIGSAAGVIFVLNDSTSSSPSSEQIQPEETPATAQTSQAIEARESVPRRPPMSSTVPSGEVDSRDEPGEKPEEEQEDEPPMEPLVGSYWEQYFEEHDLFWGPFPGVYDGYRFPWLSADIQRFIDDPLFNPAGLELTPNERAELQLIVSEAAEEIDAARKAILKEYSEVAMSIARDVGEPLPPDDDGRRPEPTRPGQVVKRIGIVTGEGPKTVIVRMNQGEYPSILDLQSKATEKRDYWIAQMLAYFESL